MVGKKTKKKVLAAITAFAVAMAMVPCGLMATQTDASAAAKIATLKTAKFKYKSKKQNKIKYTTKYSGTYGKTKLVGLCAAKGKESLTGSKKYNLYSTSAYCKGNSMAEMAYYYGYVKGWKSGVNGGKLSSAFNYVSTDKSVKDRGRANDFSKTTLKNMVKQADKYVKKHPIPKSFKCYYAVYSSKYQPAVVWSTK